MATEVASIAASAQKAFDANDALVNALKKQMDAVKAEVGSATSDEASIESMVRSTEIKRQQYADLYKRASELETERRVLIGNTRLVSLAELPTKPFFPKKIPFLAAGGTLGLLLAFVAAFFGDRVNLAGLSRLRRQLFARCVQPRRRRACRRSCTCRRSLRRSLRPCSGDCPRDAACPGPPLPTSSSGIVRHHRRARSGTIADRQARSIGIADRCDPHGAVSRPAVARAAARAAGSALSGCTPRSGDGPARYERRQDTPQDSGRVADDGRGQTFLTLTLAQYLATAGRSVLVIECDFGAPKFETALGLCSSMGLQGILRGDITPREAVIRTATSQSRRHSCRAVLGIR